MQMQHVNRRARMMLKWIAALFAVSALISAAGVLAFSLSLPSLDGAAPASGLQANVSIARDAEGVPTISGATREDVAYATGFAHAQDRFFQMDLLRRSSAGTLAALIGPAALKVDRERRIYGFDALAGPALARLSPADRRILERYAAGVNAGLAALRVRPFEYLVLRTKPQPWRPEDSLLVIWSMYFELQGNLLHREFARGWLRAHTDAQALRTLLPECSGWDAPLDAPSMQCGATPIDGVAPEWFGGPSPSAQAVAVLHERDALSDLPFGTATGSNAWAVSGKHSTTGSAIVANDMHLGLRLPNIWYRAVLEYPASMGKLRRIVGVTLPGTPAVVAGSNGAVAWGFSNSYGDYLDLVQLQSDSHHPDAYRTANGWAPLRFREEVLRVRGAPDETIRVAQTDLGPVWQAGDRRYAVRWIAEDEGAVNLNLLRAEAAADVPEALAAGQAAGIPAQNLIVGDVAGNIGWTIAGAMPDRRASFEATFPYASDAPTKGWRSRLPADDHPSIVNPASGLLWSANSRQLAGSGYDVIGDGGADPGARARQIRDDLAARPSFDEAAAYAPGLDDRALFMSAWRERALRALDERALANHPQRAEFKRLLLERWDGCACVGSVAYRLSRRYLSSLYAELFGEADREMRKLDPSASFAQATSRWPIVLARLVDQQPSNWLPLRRKTWREIELAAIDDSIARLTRGGAALKDATWGQSNTAHIVHPFAAVFPALSRWLAAPADALPGDGNMPRVATPTFGQSERMVISPGHEDLGIFNMPGGQSGRPMSAYFLAGHEAWVEGRKTPLLPGPRVHLLVLTPAEARGEKPARVPGSH